MKIKLSIQEIVTDFEEQIRYDERINMLNEMEMIESKDNKEHSEYIKKLCEKYIPNYKEYIESYKNENEKNIILNNMIYKNFKEIIYGLV